MTIKVFKPLPDIGVRPAAKLKFDHHEGGVPVINAEEQGSSVRAI
ncbi:hypothetical protein PH547_21815 [Rhizobium sp. CNPSo 3464]|nr:hypothetical protein [Rhizobium sp. CNPSo 3464]MDK4741527.1 hypothetical protein [Rhizobium sp. CNPSo 3464]